MSEHLASPFIDPDYKPDPYPRGFDPDAFLAAIEQGAEEIDLPVFIANPSSEYLDALMELAR